MPDPKTLSNVKSIISWDLKANETGAIFELYKYKPISVTVDGTFGGASVIIEGNNSTNEIMFPLNDPNGYVLDFHVPKIEAILEDCARIRARVDGGNASTNLKVNILISPWR